MDVVSNNTISNAHFPLQTWELTFYCIIFIVGLIGNSLVCIVVLKSGEQFRSVPFNIYLMALAFTDLCVSVIGLPVYVLSTAVYPHPSGSRGISMCKSITGYLIPFWLGGASIYLLVYISFERYNAVNRPMLSRLKTVSKKTIFCIILSWVIGLVIQIPTILGITYDPKSPVIGNYCSYKWKNDTIRDAVYACTFTLQFMIPALLFIVNFFRIKKCLDKFECSLKFTFGAGSNLKQRMQIMKRKRNTIRTIFIASVAFFVCWTPNNVMYFLFQYANFHKIHWNSNLFQAGILLGFFSSCVNPILYSFQSKEFRQHCKRVLNKMFCDARRRDILSSSYSSTTTSSRRTLLNFSL